MVQSSISAGEELPHYRPKTTWRSKPRMESSVPPIQEFGTQRCLKLVEDSLSVWSLGRLCDESRYSNSGQPGGNPKLTTRKKPSRAAPAILFLSSLSVSRKPLHLSGTTPPEKSRARYRSGGSPARVAPKVCSTTAQYWSGQHFYPKKKKQGKTLLREQNFVRLQPMLEETLT